MKRIKSVIVVIMTVATMVLVGAVPAMAESPFPFCGWFYTEGDGADYRSHGVALYYESWYGWHQWCESPIRGWYVIQ